MAVTSRNGIPLFRVVSFFLCVFFTHVGRCVFRLNIWPPGNPFALEVEKRVEPVIRFGVANHATAAAVENQLSFERIDLLTCALEKTVP